METEKSRRKLMTVREMGDLLGIKKTERYYLVKKGFFEVISLNGQMWVIRDSFEKWYANQVKYKKITGEEPGRELKEWSYSPKDIARILEVHETTVYEILRTNHIETVTVDYWKRVPITAFEKWYNSQTRYKTKEDKEKNASKKKNRNLLTQTEAAELAGVSRATIQRWVEKGYFHEVVAGTVVRIPREPFEKWLQKKTSEEEA